MARKTFDAAAFLHSEFVEHHDVASRTEAAVAAPFARLVGICADALRAGNKLMLLGNGGSAADAQHLATELTVRYKTNRPAIAALALTTDTSALTAIGNDFSFDDLFSRQIEALAKPGDVVLGISTSGNSGNVLRALEKAKELGCHAAAFSGRDGGKLVGRADPLLIVPSQTTARIQEMHILIGQALCNAIEYELGYA